MSNKTFTLSQTLYDYLTGASLRETPLLRRLRQETAQHPLARMQIAPEQGQLMALLVQLMGARRTLEVGVFTGYSSLAVAQVLPADGRIVACDISATWTAVAQRYWQQAGVAEKIDLRLAPALETLDHLLEAGEAEGFDFAFIDADKENYLKYFERCLRLVRRGGLIAVDNVLWSGRVADDSDTEPDTLAIRAFNRSLHNDQRVVLSMLPVGDGLTLALKR